ncbi:hypothetical protein ABT369_28295 [Dactylosporangium sp. NPDC000244]|uniref:hypothetical protein n=1 Tax=Dactylosporangium sp. NPDC000244 TaxID=3154365 RepID=UPI0033260328
MAATAVGLVLGAAYLGGRSRRPETLPVAATFRAVGVAAVPTRRRLDVVSHRRVGGGHRGVGRASRSDARARLVPNGIHRSGRRWLELDRQRFAHLVRGGAR